MTEELAQALLRIEWATGKFEHDAVATLARHREAATPHLLRLLDDTNNRAAELAEEDGYMAHLYAMYLLAQFRETRAYAPIVRFASLPGHTLDSLCGDFVPGGIDAVLASVCGGDLKGIQSIIENDAAYDWARAAALSSLVTLVAAGVSSREEIVNYFDSLFKGRLKREGSCLWGVLVSSASSLYPAELMEEIRQAYRDGLADPGYINLDDVTRDLNAGKEPVLAKLAANSNLQLVSDAAEEMQWWDCFRPQPPPKPLPKQPRAAVPLATPPAPPKPGRNDPCPCRSGKKYKKCCGQ